MGFPVGTQTASTLSSKEKQLSQRQREKNTSQHLPPEVRAAQSWRERKIFLRERERERVWQREKGFIKGGGPQKKGKWERWTAFQAFFPRRGPSSITGLFFQERAEQYYRYFSPEEVWEILQVHFSRRGPSGITGIFFQERAKRYYRYIFPGEGVRSQLKHLFLLLSLGMLRAAASIPWDPLRPPSDPSSVMGSSVAVELRLRAGLDRPRRGSVAALGEGEMSGRLLTLWYISVGWYSWRYWESSLYADP